MEFKNILKKNYLKTFSEILWEKFLQNLYHTTFKNFYKNMIKKVLWIWALPDNFRPAMDKHSSLFCGTVSYKEKKVYDTDKSYKDW